MFLSGTYLGNIHESEKDSIFSRGGPLEVRLSSPVAHRTGFKRTGFFKAGASKTRWVLRLASAAFLWAEAMSLFCGCFGPKDMFADGAGL